MSMVAAIWRGQEDGSQGVRRGALPLLLATPLQYRPLPQAHTQDCSALGLSHLGAQRPADVDKQVLFRAPPMGSLPIPPLGE